MTNDFFIEPYKIKVAEPISTGDREEREKILRHFTAQLEPLWGEEGHDV